MDTRKILIVEDDKPIAELLAYRLGKEGYESSVALTGSAGLKKAREENPGLVLLDWNLPDISGLDVCRQITETQRIPIIMVTAKNMIEDKVLGLEAGADDYITKPFDVREVVARIKATFRRMDSRKPAQAPQASRRIAFGGLEVDTGSMNVYRQGKPVELTLLEYNLLLYLYENRNLVLTREQILSAVWDIDFYGNTRTVDIHVMRLRKKLELDDVIQTVFKVGYKFVL
jgi:two-component system, OmpR family, alkaline phosphatase synthesis response regulator PhoP